MSCRSVAELVLLAALWGASFLFMRVAAPQFGPVPLIGVRVAVAAACLAPVLPLLLRGRADLHQTAAGLRTYAVPAVVMGVLNSVIPFCLVASATLSVTAGFAALLNATAPFFAAIVARLWSGERMAPARAAGLVVGFGGVVVLTWGNASFKPGGSGWAVLAGLVASACYGVAANYTKHRAAALNPLALAAASQVAAALVLMPPTLWWLARAGAVPSANAWAMAVALGVLCTAVAYVLYFRLLASVGPTRAIAVTFLIPLFATGWGLVFLHEAVTPRMVVGMALVLTGTALTTGVLGRRRTPAVQTGVGFHATTSR